MTFMDTASEYKAIVFSTRSSQRKFSKILGIVHKVGGNQFHGHLQIKKGKLKQRWKNFGIVRHSCVVVVCFFKHPKIPHSNKYVEALTCAISLSFWLHTWIIFVKKLSSVRVHLRLGRSSQTLFGKHCFTSNLFITAYLACCVSGFF